MGILFNLVFFFSESKLLKKKAKKKKERKEKENQTILQRCQYFDFFLFMQATAKE